MPATVLAIMEAQKLYGDARNFYKNLIGKYSKGTAHVQVWSEMPKLFYEYVKPGITAYPGEKNYVPMPDALFDIRTGRHIATSEEAIKIYNEANAREWEKKARKQGERVTGEYSLTVVPVKGEEFTGYVTINGVKYDKTFYTLNGKVTNISNTDKQIKDIPKTPNIITELEKNKEIFEKEIEKNKDKEMMEKATKPPDSKIKNMDIEVSNSSIIIFGIIILGAIFVFNKSK